MSTPQPFPAEQDVMDSPVFKQYLEARTDLMRLAPFITLTPECKTYESLYQRYLSPTLPRS